MRILIPVDGSYYSRLAVSFVANRVKEFGGDPTVVLLNVQNLVPELISRSLGLEAIEAYYQAEGKKVFEELDDILRSTGLEVKKTIRNGHYAHVIAQVADEMNADLIVMGSHGRGAMTSLIMGSVSRDVLAVTQRPLLLVRGPDEMPSKLRIGICVDNSDYGRIAAEFVADFHEFFGASSEFSVISVVPSLNGVARDDVKNLDDTAGAESDAFKEAAGPVLSVFELAKIPLKPVCLVGNDPAKEIIKYANDNLDMLVMGSHGYGNFRASVLGSTAQHVAAGIRMPLLIIKR